MKKYFPFLCLAVMIAVSFSACKKKDDFVHSDSIEDYNPLVVGKYITYKLDSFVYTNFGVSSEIRSYEVKHQVDAQIADAMGRPAFRIIRYIRKTSANPWLPDASFMAVNTGNGLEFTENNLRYIKLKTPIRDYYTWKGNSFIDTYSTYSDLQYLDDWDYSYDSVGVAQTIGTFALDSTLKVDQRDEVVGFPNVTTSYSEINYSVEKYAKHIGLVYRKFFHNEYQPPTPGQGGRYVDGSYGVTLTMIDHN